MMQGTYTAASGIAAQQKSLDTIAHNLANVNTNGYKSSRTDFKDALYQNMQRVEQPQDGLNLQKGHGTLVSGFVTNFSPGQFLDTGRELDCYIDGEGFFAVQAPNGETLYTRDGAFAKSNEGGVEYLVTSQGYYVLDQNGQKIVMQGTDVNISPEGLISQGDGSQAYAEIGLFRFDNQTGLNAVGTNLFEVSESSGAAEAASDATKIHQGVLEGSNVNMADEFAKLIRTQRTMQVSSRALSMADEMDGTAISTRR